MTETWSDIDPRVWPADRISDPTSRRPFFGASHTAVLFGKHPFQTAASYWLDKRDGTSTPTTDAMMRGVYLESSIIEWYRSEVEDVKYVDAWQPGAPIQRGHLLCVPDMVRDDRILSIKTTARRTDEVEDYWFFQVQTEMLITGIEEATIAWLDGSMQLKHAGVEFDPTVADEIWQLSSEFMASIDSGEMPDWVERSADDVIRQYAGHVVTDPVEADDNVLELVRNYYHMKEQAAQYDKAAAEFRRQIFNAAEDHAAITWQGDVIAELKERSGSKRIDTKQLAANHPDLAAKYTVEGAPTRALTIPKAAKERIL